MKFPAICVAALLATSASAESHEYRVLFGGDDVGGLEVETDGDTSTIVFDYKQNGRGPTIAETLKLLILLHQRLLLLMDNLFLVKVCLVVLSKD